MSGRGRYARLLLALACCGTLAGGHPAAAAPPAAPPAGAVAPAPLPVPEWVGARESRGRILLTWIRNPAFRSVRVYRRTGEGGAAFAQIGETAENTFLDERATPGTAYRYRLTGVGADGRESRPSAELSTKIAAVVLRPPAPPAWEGFILVEDGVGLKWSAREGEDVIAYNVYRRAPPETEYRLVGSSRGTSFHDTGLEPGRDYLYALTALDSSFRETAYSLELPVRYQRPQPAAEKKAEAVWRVRRTRLVAIVAAGDRPMLRPVDVAVGPVTGNIYLSDSGTNRLSVFTRQGVFQRSLPAGEAEAFGRLLGLGVDRDETVYAVDTRAEAVFAFSLRGTAGRRVEVPRVNGVARGVIDTAVADDGRLYVVDNTDNEVAVIGREGAFRAFGKAGYGGGEFSAPTFCATGPDGSLYVADALNARIQVFTAGGEFLRAFGRYQHGPGGLGRPKGVAVSDAGEVYVADSWFNTVQVFGSEGQFVAILGDEAGRPLDLGSPNGVALGPGNRVVIAERLAGRLQIRETVDER